jgi:Tfp pilus assembly protein PilZ
MAEKRRAKRFARRLLIRFGEQDLSKTGFVSDISQGGVFVAADTVPNVGARIHLQIELSPTQSVYAEGVVRRQKLVPPKFRSMEKSGFGVRFLDPEELVAEIVPQLRAETLAAAEERFAVSFATIEMLRTAYERELKHGGVFLRTDRVLPRDAPAMITLELAFAGQRFEIAAKVLQIVEGTTKGLGFVFDDRTKIAVALAPFL